MFHFGAFFHKQLDTMWNDIDYMDQFKIFTLDPVNYPELEMKKFVAELHANHQQYIVIVDPGVKVEKGFPLFDELVQKGLAIKKSDGKTPIVNKCWPGLAIFPDFTANATSDYWHQAIEKFYQIVPVDGLWLDMNEQVSVCAQSFQAFLSFSQVCS